MMNRTLAAGTVLFVVGLVGLVLAMIYTFWWARRDAYDDARVVQFTPAAICELFERLPAARVIPGGLISPSQTF